MGKTEVQHRKPHLGNNSADPIAARFWKLPQPRIKRLISETVPPHTLRRDKIKSESIDVDLKYTDAGNLLANAFLVRIRKIESRRRNPHMPHAVDSSIEVLMSMTAENELQIEAREQAQQTLARFVRHVANVRRWKSVPLRPRTVRSS